MYILYQSDENYVPIMGISITSLFENNQDIEYLKVFIAEYKIKDESKDKLIKLAERYNREIEFLDMTNFDAYLESMGLPKWRGAYSACYKLFLTQYFPDYVDRILYIDCDTIIMPGVIDANSIDLPDHAIAMVRSENKKEYLKKSGAGDYYYNTGVILFNIQNWKRFNCENIILEKAKTPQPLLYPDQDLIVISIPQYIQKLPFRFNVESGIIYGGVRYYWKNSNGTKEHIYSLDEIRDAAKYPTIGHCISGFYGRPWEKGNFNPYKQKWDRYRGMSPWPEFETEWKRSKKYKTYCDMCQILPRPGVKLINSLLAIRNSKKLIQYIKRHETFEHLAK